MPSPAITSFSFTTDDFPAADRFAAWREVVSATHETDTLGDGTSPFHTDITVWKLDQLAVSSGSFTAQAFARSAETIRHDQIDHMLLFVQGRGTRQCRMGRDEELLREFDIHIVDMAQPESSVTTAGNSGTLYVPRDLAEEILPTISGFHGRVLRDRMSTLLAQHLLAIGRHLPFLPAATHSHLVHATMEMAIACLQSLESGTWEMNSSVVFALRRRVERHIESRLDDPNISPASVAQACAMSRSTLYRFFEPHGGVMLYVKRRRLHRLRSILIAGEDVRSLAEISEDYGFQSGAHFGREFRKEFGYPPGEIRGKRSTESEAPAPGDLGQLLQSLRF